MAIFSQGEKRLELLRRTRKGLNLSLFLVLVLCCFLGALFSYTCAFRTWGVNQWNAEKKRAVLVNWRCIDGGEREVRNRGASNYIAETRQGISITTHKRLCLFCFFLHETNFAFNLVKVQPDPYPTSYVYIFSVLWVSYLANLICNLESYILFGTHLKSSQSLGGQPKWNHAIWGHL